MEVDVTDAEIIMIFRRLRFRLLRKASEFDDIFMVVTKNSLELLELSDPKFLKRIVERLGKTNPENSRRVSVFKCATLFGRVVFSGPLWAFEAQLLKTTINISWAGFNRHDDHMIFRLSLIKLKLHYTTLITPNMITSEQRFLYCGNSTYCTIG